jgi:membrane fusion protein (multidrug efflux system)
MNVATDQTTPASESELAQLREEVRRLREEQERVKQQRQNGGQREKNPDGEDDDGKKDEHPDKKEEAKHNKPHPLRKVIIIAVVLIIAAAGLLFWLRSRHYEDTDDAYVDGHISGLAARVSGTITGVYVEEDQFVKAGEVVVDLDPRDYKIALEQGESQLAQARAQRQATQPNVPVTQVTNRTTIVNAASDVTSAEAGVAAAERDYEAAIDKIRESQANNTKAQADVARYRPLAEKDEIPREQFDQVIANATALAATVAANQASAAAASKLVDQRRAQLQQAQQRAEEARTNAPRQLAVRQADVMTRQAAIQTALAQVDQARLNLSYCKIISPVDGIVAKRMAEIGQGVTPGQQVLLVTQINDLWVTANFRETQLRRMHPGQSVRVHVDAISGDFDAYVESMPGATGSVVSLLPPENATGNFVKVVQRLPVRIRFKKNQKGLDRLRPGMSVEPKVRVD